MSWELPPRSFPPGKVTTYRNVAWLSRHDGIALTFPLRTSAG